MRSGLSCVGAPLPPIDDVGGFPRAALRVPSGVDEAVMFDMVDVEVMSEVVRGGELSRGCVGLPSGGECISESGVSAGEAGGDGESRGDAGSSLSCESIVMCGA